jgi:hypothetical protein
MGNLLRIKNVHFQWLTVDYQRPTQRREAPRLARNKPLFKLNRTRNKSGALLLTIFEFTMRRGDERFTMRCAASAVRDGVFWRFLLLRHAPVIAAGGLAADESCRVQLNKIRTRIENDHLQK